MTNAARTLWYFSLPLSTAAAAVALFVMLRFQR